MKWMLFGAIALCGLSTADAQRTAPKPEAPRGIPALYWTQGIETADALRQAGINRIAVPAGAVAAWRAAGFQVIAMSARELERRETLLAPRIAGRANVASATRRPWIDANGWRFMRNPAGGFLYDLTQAARAKASLALAEAFVYRADAVLKLDPAQASQLAEAGKMAHFLRELQRGSPPHDLPVIADIGVIDDGSAAMGEVLNLLTRRNLLFAFVPAASARYRVNIKFGTNEFPAADAANPSDFAQKVRQQLGDDNRSLRIYGSEVVIGRLAGDARGARLHLLNYSGNEIEGLRVRLRGRYAGAEAIIFGFDREPVQEFAVADGATEFSLPHLGVYAVVALPGFK
jgi:hypothetical protein